MQRVYEYQLNESLSNADCRELYFDRRFLPLREAFILFCRHYRLIEGGNQETMITIVHVNKT